MGNIGISASAVSLEANIYQKITEAKVISAVMVVFLHVSNIIWMVFNDDVPLLLDIFTSPVTRICNLSVPVFFTISAYLLFRKEFRYRDNAIKKIRTLLIPYLFWNIAVLLYSGFLTWRKDPGAFDWHFFEISKLIGIPFSQPPACVPLWFMRDLFIMNLCAPLFRFAARKAPKISLLIVLVLWISPLDTHLRRAITFFMLGTVIALHPAFISKIRAMNPTAAYLLSAASLLGAIIGENVMESLSIFILVCLGNFWMDKWVNNRPLKLLSNHIIPDTFLIYAAHVTVIGIFDKFILEYAKTSALSVGIYYFMMPVIVIAGCICFSKLFRKFMPRLYRIATGGR